MSIICKFCNKEYKSYSSRSNHIRLYHKKDSSSKTSISSSKTSIPLKSESPGKSINLLCNKCNKTFSRSDNLKRHIINCKKNDSSVDDILTENEILKQHLKKQEEMMKQLIASLNKNAKIHPPGFL